MVSMNRVLLVLVLLVLTACQQAQPPAEEGTLVTVHVIDNTRDQHPSVAAVAYQPGTGEWQMARTENYGEYFFYVPTGETRYAVAVNCLSGYLLQFYHLTLDETRSLSVYCQVPGSAAVGSMRALVKAGAGYDRITVFSDVEQVSDILTDDILVELSALQGQERDFAFAAYDGGTAPDEMTYLKLVRGVNLAPAADLGEVSFTAADAVSRSTVAGFSASVPSGYASAYKVRLLSAAGLGGLTLAAGDASGGQYVTLPNPVAGDLYAAQARASELSASSFREISQLKLIPATEAGAIAFELPSASFAPTATAEAFPEFKHLNTDAGDVLGYYLLSAPAGGAPTRANVSLVSSAWLAGSGADGYQTPDLRHLPGFDGTGLPSGESIWTAIVIYGNATAGELVAGPLLPAETGSSLFLNIPVSRLPGLELNQISVGAVMTIP